MRSDTELVVSANSAHLCGAASAEILSARFSQLDDNLIPNSSFICTAILRSETVFPRTVLQ